MTKNAEQIKAIVLDSLELAELSDGPQGHDYLVLMVDLKNEIDSRIGDYLKLNPPVLSV